MMRLYGSLLAELQQVGRGSYKMFTDCCREQPYNLIMSNKKTLCLPLLLAWLFVIPFAGQPSAQEPERRKHHFSEARRFVFYAVLEGCYEDGLTGGAIDLIIPADEDGHRQLTVNFVYQCPLCGPAFDAFNVYSTRQRFANAPKDVGQDPYNTFGEGLSAEVMGELAKPGLPCRNAIQSLIDKWVTARMKRLRLTEDETTTLREELAEMRKSGEFWLKSFQRGGHGYKLKEAYKDWNSCPICSGASPMGAAVP